MWNRTAEHAMKLSLLGCDGDYLISLSSFEWAAGLAQWLTRNTIEKIRDNISNNAYESDLQKVKNIIKKSKHITRSNLTRHTQFLDRRRRDDIINNLLEAGFIVSETENKKTVYKSVDT